LPFLPAVRELFSRPHVLGKFLILLLIVLLLFSSRLPSVARALGQSITEFKKGFKELEDHSDDDKSA
jgi:TatA/E family protein of Tat protein translocase